MGLREKLLATSDTLRREQVPLPDFGCPVYVREMSGRARDNYEKFVKSLVDHETGVLQSEMSVKYRVIRLTVEDEDEAPVFAEGDEQEIEKMPARVINALFRPAAILSGIISEDEPEDEETEEYLTDDEEAEKNAERPAGTL
jgi:hypothetical protein